MENNIEKKSLWEFIVEYRQTIGALLLMLSGALMVLFLESHIGAILNMSRYNIIAFYLFCIVMLGTIMIFNGFNLKKNNTLPMYIISAVMTLFIIILVITYVTMISRNVALDAAIEWKGKVLSVIILSISAFINLVGIGILATCINFHPVKES